MRKRSFLSGVSAKLALAAVALTSMMFTSCEKEEFNFAPVEVEPASATILVTVYDLNDGSVITDAAITENGAAVSNSIKVEAGEDGTIATATRTFAATKSGYVAGEGQATIPALAKGKSAVVPVSIFLQRVDAAFDNPTAKDEEDAKLSDDKTVMMDLGDNTEAGEEPIVKSIKYDAEYGQKVQNLSDVEKWIDAMPTTKAMSAADVKNVLKALVASYNPGIEKREMVKDIIIMPFTKLVSVNIINNYKTTKKSITATVDGVSYTVPGVEIKEVVNTVVDPQFISVAHGHDHGHGHGDGNNAGGGIGEN